MRKPACKPADACSDCCNAHCQKYMICHNDNCHINTHDDYGISYQLNIDDEIIDSCTEVPVIIWEEQCKCSEAKNITFNVPQLVDTPLPPSTECRKLINRLTGGRAVECDTRTSNGCCTEYKLKTITHEGTAVNNIQTTAILGAVIGVLLLIIVVMLAMFLLYRRRKSTRGEERNNTTRSSRQQNFDRSASLTYATIDEVDLDPHKNESNQWAVENRSYNGDNDAIVKGPPTIVSRRPTDHNYVEIETKHNAKPCDITYKASSSEKEENGDDYHLVDDDIQSKTENSDQDYDKLRSQTEKINLNVGNYDYHHVKKMISEASEDYDKLDSQSQKGKPYIDNDTYHHVKKVISEESEDYDKLDSQSEKGKPFVDNDDYYHVKRMTSESEDYDKLDIQSQKGKPFVDNDDYHHVKRMTSEKSEDKVECQSENGKPCIDNDDYHHLKEI